MDIQSLLKLWPQYQMWLKQNGITDENIKEKFPMFIQQIRQNPEQSKRLDTILSSSELSNFAKVLNLSQEQVDNIKSIFSAKEQTKIGKGNLTQEQLNMIKRFKR